MKEAFELTFSNGLTAHAIQVDRGAELSAALHELDFHHPYRTLVLVGGASGLDDAELDRLRPLFVEAVIPPLKALDAAVVDGGTDTGVMRLIGQAHAETKATFPLIGVAAIGTVALPGVCTPPSPDAARLEPHHARFVLVPGSEWGDESPWLSCVARTLARAAPSVTLLVNGGETAWEDVSHSVEASRPVIVIDGSGRTADRLAGALRGELTDERAKELSESGMLSAIDVTTSFDTLASTLEQNLSSRKRIM